MKKIFFLVIDGLGDDSIPQLKNKTPLEAAHTPNLDFFAKNGCCGSLSPFFSGVMPTSEEGHYALFGYNSLEYKIKRGVVTALGSGIKLKERDISFRGNFATVDDNLNVIDRRAGRIKKTKKLIESLRNIKIKDIDILIENAQEHRLALVLRGKGLSSNVSDGDPHYRNLGTKISEIIPLDQSKESIFTAEKINLFLSKAHQVLKNHPENKKRNIPANYILLRGASSFSELPKFKDKYNLYAACVAGKNLYKSIAKSVGMKVFKVLGADGSINTNIKGKIKKSIKLLESYDFVFTHIKATDTLAEDGNYLKKKEFIEKIDKELKRLIEKDFLIVITSDHSTSSLKKSHCTIPIPFLLFNSLYEKDSTSFFSEKDSLKGSLGKIDQIEFMKIVLEGLPCKIKNV